jgi:hypothetical protein
VLLQVANSGPLFEAQTRFTRVPTLALRWGPIFLPAVFHGYSRSRVILLARASATWL